MKRRGNVIRGRFGARHRRPTGLPPELTAILDIEQKRRNRWLRYAPLWLSAVAVGTLIGVTPSLWPSAPAAPSGPNPTIAPQTIPDEPVSVEEKDWKNRAGEDDAALSRQAPSAPAPTVAFGFCYTGGGYNCVVDGDTIWLAGQKVRLADIDAPETHDYRCTEEKVLGDRATQRLIQLVSSGPVTLQPIDRDQDKYGRKLRIVVVNGTSVGDTLVNEGLARYYEGGRKPWC